MQKAIHLVRTEMDVEKIRKKTYYGYCAYGPTYIEVEQLLVFFATVKKEKPKSSCIFKKDHTLTWNSIAL